MNPQELEQKKLISNDYYNEVLKSGKKIFTTTIDEVFKEKEIMPNIVKLDAHGAEGKILSGSKNYAIQRPEWWKFEKSLSESKIFIPN